MLIKKSLQRKKTGYFIPDYKSGRDETPRRPAEIKITATDYSLFKNQAILSQTIKIDTVPPQINLLKNMNYINQGGTGFVAYQIHPRQLLLREFTSMIILLPAHATYGSTTSLLISLISRCQWTRTKQKQE